ncbi:MAG: rhodanese-like domain-containing protein [Candidatus Thiodiazotropha sp.]
MEKIVDSKLSPSDLYALQRQGKRVELLDVRTAVEFRQGHIPGAQLMTLDTLNDKTLKNQLGDPELRNRASLYITCQSGFRAQQAAERLKEAGYQNVVLVDGGTEAWQKAGLPIMRCGEVISLERQVQITIGSLLLLKVLFGFTLHEVFFLAGAFIGAGLIMAGVTRWIGSTDRTVALESQSGLW